MEGAHEGPTAEFLFTYFLALEAEGICIAPRIPLRALLGCADLQACPQWGMEAGEQP